MYIIPSLIHYLLRYAYLSYMVTRLLGVTRHEEVTQFWRDISEGDHLEERDDRIILRMNLCYVRDPEVHIA